MSHAATSAGTEVPANPGFPPFKTESYPSQLFWLTVSFAVLFVVMWRIAGPRIKAAIEGRKAKIDGDLTQAATAKQAAEKALADYQGELSAAKARAGKLAEENRKAFEAEVEKAKAQAEAEAAVATAEAERRIAAMQLEAGKGVETAAEEAAAAIVDRLIGETVSAEEAAQAVQSVRAS
jgi:F-type H+-transporting ATPase subunit b